MFQVSRFSRHQSPLAFRQAYERRAATTIQAARRAAIAAKPRTVRAVSPRQIGEGFSVLGESLKGYMKNSR